MTIKEMSGKFTTANGNMLIRDLGSVVSGGSADDFVANGTIARIIEESKTGYYDERFSKNAVVVIMERCELKDGKIHGLGEAVQVPLGMFDRAATPYKQEGDGKVVREEGKETVRATGSAVIDWKKAPNAKAFMEAHIGRAIKFTEDAIVKVRAWDRATQAFSTTELRDQKVYKIEWVDDAK